MAENELAWNLWLLCNNHERLEGQTGLKKLSLIIIAEVCELYNADFENYNKVVILENILYPKLQTVSRKKSD